MTIPEEVTSIVDAQLDILKGFATIPIKKEELFEDIPAELLEDVNRTKLEKFVFVYYAKQLRDQPHLHRKYDNDKIPEGLWQPMTRLLTAIRVQELKNVKVVRRKGKYDIKALREAYFGRKLLDDLPDLGNRWMLSEKEYQKIQLQCRKLELDLPEVIEPTTTEKFFEE